MTEREKHLGDFLFDDLNNLCGCLIDKYDLKHTPDGDESAVFRWVEFRLRHFDQIPRRVHTSREVKTFLASADPDVKQKYKHLHDKVEAGENINPFQSRTLYTHNLEAPNPNRRTDMLWADWNVSHFHLSNQPDTKDPRIMARSGHNLFAYSTGSDLYFLDIRPHPKTGEFGYSNTEFLSIIHGNWPGLLDQFELKGFGTIDNTKQTPEIIQALRQSGTNILIGLNGKIYAPPGGGLATDCTPIRVTESVICFRRLLRGHAQSLERTYPGWLDGERDFVINVCHDVNGNNYQVGIHQLSTKEMQVIAELDWLIPFWAIRKLYDLQSQPTLYAPDDTGTRCDIELYSPP